MNRRRVVVTGIGVLTPLGDRVGALHRALCQGAGGIRVLGDEETAGAGPLAAAPLDEFDPAAYLGKRGLRGMDRASRLTAVAAALALEDAGRLADGVASGEVGLVLGTMLSGVRTTARFDRRAVTAGPGYAKPMDFANTVINAAAGQAAIRLGLKGLNATVSSGIASGVQALGYAMDLIRAGRADTLLAGGMDEVSSESLLAFRGAGLLAGNGGSADRRPVPCDQGRNGLALGEAAAFLVLEEAAAADRRGARVLAELKGHGAAFDPFERRRGRGGPGALSRAVRFALEDADLSPSDLESAVLSANGAPRGDLDEALGLEDALGGRVGEIVVGAPKGALGESLGASGALAAALLIEASRTGSLPGIAGLDSPDPALPYRELAPGPRPVGDGAGLVSSHGLDGKSAALLLEAPGAAA